MLKNTLIKTALVIILLSPLAIADKSKENKKCRVLALEGGGDKGAYQAGAIQALVNGMPEEERKWDVVSGVSVGSLNGVMMALHEVGDEKTAAEALLTEWRQITGGNYLFRNWPWGGVIRGYYFETGFFDTTPLRENLQTILNKFGTLKRQFVAGSVDTETGDYVVFNNESMKTQDQIKNSVCASGAYPVVFPLHKYGGVSYMDGGAVRSLDIASGVHRCEDMGFEHEDIIVDVVLCSMKTMANVDPETLRPLSVLGRYLQMVEYDYTMRALEDTLHFLKNVTIRYVVGPTKKLPSGMIPLSFSPSEIEQMINMGIDDANAVISLGPGENLKRLLNENSVKQDTEDFYLRRGKHSKKPTGKTNTTTDETKETSTSKKIKFFE